MKQKTITAMIITSALFLDSKGVSHASSTSLGVYPALTRIRAKYKAHVVSPITILNNSNEVIKLKVSYRAFTSTPENSIQYYSEKDTPLYISNFLNTIKLYDGENEAKIITAFPKQYKNVSIQFDTPIGEKDFYFTTLFTPEKTANSIDETRISVNTSIGSNFLITVNKKDYSGLINQFKINSVIINDKTPITLNVKNTSENFVTATGVINIYDFLGKRVSQIKIYPTTILSNSSQNMYQLTNGNREQIHWNQKFTLGFYSAEAEIKFDNNYSLKSKTETFGAPLIIIIALSLVFFILVSVLYKVIRKLNFKE